jgi:hypothetical protein
MANLLYTAARAAFMKAELDWDAAVPIKVMLIRTVQGAGAGGNAVYTVSATHTSLADVPNNGYCRATDGVELTGRAVNSDAEAEADNVTFDAVPAGDPIQAILIYADPVEAQSDADRLLIAYYDTGGSMPITPNGGDITVTWPTSSPYLFGL